MSKRNRSPPTPTPPPVPTYPDVPSTPPLSSCRAQFANIDFLEPLDRPTHIPPSTFSTWDKNPTYTPPSTTPNFTTSPFPSLAFHLHKTSLHARASTLHFPPRPALHRTGSVAVETPIFMPVGTKGTIKGLTYTELTDDALALNPPIILGNTYHLALDPGTPVLDAAAGLHNFSTWPNAMLTDSGGFQMVSLLKLAVINEQGVEFESPYAHDNGRRIMLRPEESMRCQNSIGGDVMMQLDDVVSSVVVDDERFEVAVYRTLRWLDRCIEGHKKKGEQNLFAIVQGGLDTKPGGLRDVCLEGFRRRDHLIPGYAIGGLAGGESKDEFWRVVAHSCRALPVNKPRYLMGVGYPLDLVVCTALGVDMYDCVYPTRTARFGVALVDGVAPGTLRLKGTEFAKDMRVIDADCGCQCCAGGFSRAKLHLMLKANEPSAAQMMTNHNIAYMLRLVRRMRAAILEDKYEAFAREFVGRFYPTGFDDKYEKEGCYPRWVVEALEAGEIDIKG